ncbi:Capsular polysaccharide biosynthesis protein [Clostridium acidisoli DSM 12555]|uniref:Capsular polysaccharide biosynthesis protein n=1 Tax=Clostridium acidisoli DSM 12555 TaxID=1121291 RepID=A0A1W1XGX2_9CLOT|nr:Wzz/FepE/Etk N-terminal domain-containing protein [Clostridium acidisoli]SMC23243.1 Capsular polysaccharide biosynthesis protein [Clostridium acidisoli DSM 12555]
MNEESSIDLSRIFYIVSKRKSIIITITLVATIISGILSIFILSPVYQSKVTVIVGKANGSNSSSNSSQQYNDVMMYQNLTKTYTSIATSTFIEDKAAQKLGGGITVEKLNGFVTVTPEEGTQILDIVATANTPQDALNRVTALSQAFVENCNSVYNAGDVRIMDKGQLPDKAIEPKKSLNIAIAFILGLMVSIGLSFLLEYMDSTIKTTDDIKRYLDLPVLGTIPMQDDI